MTVLSVRRLCLACFMIGIAAVLSVTHSGRILAQQQPAEQQSADQPTVTLLPDGVELTWHLPKIGQEDNRFKLTGFADSQIPGRPMLPMQSVGVALPPGADPVLTITRLGKTEQISLAKPIPLAPMPSGVVQSEAGDVIGGAFAPAEADLDFAAERVTFEEIGTMGGVRLGRLTFQPVLPAANAESSYQILRDVAVRLDFQTGVPSIRTADVIDESDTLAAVRGAVINPTQVMAALQSRTAEDVHMAPLPSVIIETDGEAGMVQVSYSQLVAAGFPLASINAAHLHLTQNNSEIGWRIVGSGSNAARLEAGESLQFYAPGKHSRWITGEVFKLIAETTPGRQMPSVAAPPTGLPSVNHTLTATAEENHIYTPQCLCGSQPLARDGDRWMWAELKRPGAESAAFEILTPNAASSGNAEVTVWLMGFTDLSQVADHKATIKLNGFNLGSVVWDGKAAKAGTFSVPASVLKASNSVSITLVETGGVLDGVWVDAIAINYGANSTVAPAGEQVALTGNSARSQYVLLVAQPANGIVFDVTTAASPSVLSGVSASGGTLSWGDPANGAKRYQVVQVNSFKSATVRLTKPLLTQNLAGADYILLAPSEFTADLSPLVNRRTAAGYSVAVEEVERIYDQFGNGEPNPAAIQAFLKDAYSRWTPRPEMVLLVGDGHYDPLKNFAGSSAVRIPPFLVDTDPWMGETAADNRFVTFDGPDDQLPEMAIGRLPVNSVAELRIAVQKIVAYETNTAAERWKGSISIVADDTDAAGNFEKHSERLVSNFFPSPWRVSRYYLQQADADGSNVLSRLKSNWTAGNGLVMFTGHSSVSQWAAERIFHSDDVPSLDHGDKLPLVMGMSCFTSSFHYPEIDVLDEQLLRKENGGAIATWGATGLGVSTGHDSLANGFFEAIFNTNDKSLGSATVSGKLRLVLDQSTHTDLLDTFTLLGDPALNLDLVQPDKEDDVLYLPIIAR